MLELKVNKAMLYSCQNANLALYFLSEFSLIIFGEVRNSINFKSLSYFQHFLLQIVNLSFFCFYLLLKDKNKLKALISKAGKLCKSDI